MSDIVDRLESSFHIYISTSGGATVKAMRPLLGEAAQEIRELRRTLSTLKPEGEQISGEAVERAHKRMMSELFLLCQPDRGDVFSFMDDRKDVVRAALEAALEPKP